MKKILPINSDERQGKMWGEGEIEAKARRRWKLITVIILDIKEQHYSTVGVCSSGYKTGLTEGGVVCGTVP